MYTIRRFGRPVHEKFLSALYNRCCSARTRVDISFLQSFNYYEILCSTKETPFLPGNPIGLLLDVNIDSYAELHG